MIKWVLFLVAVFVSLPTWVLADEVAFQARIGSGIGVEDAVMPNGLSRAGFLNGTLMRADVNVGHFPIPGMGQSGWGVPGFSSIIQVEDGVISISVPEPGTMGTLATGLAILAGLMRLKSSKSKLFSTLSPCRRIPFCSGLLTESTVWK